MAGYAAQRSIGARIAAARRSRGYRSADALAAALYGTGITASIIENIEAGRRANLDVSIVLNIARVLGVPVSALLAPIARPDDPLDLANLGPAFDGMSASEFDTWMSTAPNSDHLAASAAERNDRAELRALRELQLQRRELDRLRQADAIEEASGRPEALAAASHNRIAAIENDITELRKYLASAGWEL
ncbi:hypothetical protein [Schumannella sp. 10F1B-5-1]|uniref:hypothetical protein n=1 Tax=Schumannella sp. 10F1B-5-1 TaxID=2590780 RepID=UPI0011300FCA|nr:hypothetical protein [Schumannella sp. 10F1B-5-1]TPW78411.1 hypothetical protein FJ658_00980 [Schumannella sp. 10F1B-5-1]